MRLLLQCEPILGRGFRLGQYKCRCRPGYEYPFIDQNDFFNGDTMDTQWDLFTNENSRTSRFDELKCRIATACAIESLHVLLLLSANALAIFLTRPV